MKRALSVARNSGLSPRNQDASPLGLTALLHVRACVVWEESKASAPGRKTPRVNVPPTGDVNRFRRPHEEKHQAHLPLREEPSEMASNSSPFDNFAENEACL